MNHTLDKSTDAKHWAYQAKGKEVERLVIGEEVAKKLLMEVKKKKEKWHCPNCPADELCETCVDKVKKNYSKRFKNEEHMPRRRKIRFILYCSCFYAFSALDPVQRLLQYLMGFAPISVFFRNNGVHESSVACDSLATILMIDTVLALLTSTLVWMIILPSIYTLAKVSFSFITYCIYNLRLETRIRL